MPNVAKISEKIENFKKIIKVPGDKSLSIRWVLFASLAKGTSKAKNLLMSEDVLAAIDAIKKLGIKVLINKKECTIYGKGINGYKYRKKLTINAQNSGTLGRLILGLLVNTPYPISLVGDKSLSIRWALMASLALGKSRAYNILNSEDVNNAILSLKKK